VHYANALLHHTSYTDIIAIGATGHKDGKDKLQTKIGVYYVSKSNLGVGRKVGEFCDLSFLNKRNFSDFTDRLKNLNLTPDELEKIKQKREKEIDASLVKLNNDIYSNEKGLGENDRVYLVAASIIATLGIPNKVAPLEKSELKSSSEGGNTDGEILMRKIRALLNEKNLPVKKKDLIIRTLSNTILTDNINKISNGETQLKRVFSKIVDDLGIYYKIGLTTDFTGKLFNEMYSWLGFTQDKLNDVVLTPSYVATLLVRLARVNKDSYVWDFATGSAGLLVAAMNPCPCGFFGDKSHACECSAGEIKRYTRKLSGPLLDRIDLHIRVSRVEYSDLHATRRAESSASIRQRVVAARTIEWERLHRHGLFCNAQMNHSMIKKYCRLEREAESLLEAAFHRINLSVRSHDRIIKVARTIADLAQSPAITAIHIAEAIQLRSDVGLNIE